MGIGTGGNGAPTNPTLMGIVNKKASGQPLTPDEFSFWNSQMNKGQNMGTANASPSFSGGGRFGSGPGGGPSPDPGASSGGGGFGSTATLTGPPLPFTGNTGEHDSGASGMSAVAGLGANQGSGGVANNGDFFSKLFGGIASSLGNANTAAYNVASAAGPTLQQLPSLNLPSAPNIQVSPKDFSGQAASMAAGAYAPSYAALDTGRANVNSNYDYASKVTAGLYDKLAADTAGKEVQSQQNTAKAQTADSANAAQTGAAISQGYSDAQGKEAAMLKSLGIEAAAPGALAASTGASSFQQGQAATQAQAQKANLTAQGQAQNNFQTNTATADANQGKADQGALLNTKKTDLNQFDAQQQAVAGQQAQQALTIGQGMTQTDLQAQQSNQSAANSSYQNQIAATQADYNAKVANQQFQMQQTAVNYDRLVAARSAQYQIQQQQFNNSLDLSKIQNQYGIDATNAGSTRLSADAAKQNSDWNVNPRNPANNRIYPVNPNSPIASQVLTGLIANGNGTGYDPTTAQNAMGVVQDIMGATNSVDNQTKAALISRATINATNKGYTGSQLQAVIDAATKYADSSGLK